MTQQIRRASPTRGSSLIDIGRPPSSPKLGLSSILKYNKHMNDQPAPDEQLQLLRRQLDLSPDDLSSRQRYLTHLRRLQRTEGCEETLLSLEQWDEASVVEQDEATAFVLAAHPAFRWLKSQVYHCNGQSHRIPTLRHEPSKVDFQLIPGGTYHMGAGPSEENDALRFYTLWEHYRPSTERPRHRVSIREPFLLGRAMLTKVDPETPVQSPLESRPLEQLTWGNARRAVRSLGPGPFDLPSEAQWEYACRGGSASTFYWGEEPAPDHCWTKNNSGFQSHPPIEHLDKTNAFGLIDMLGNVREWCADWFEEDHSGAPGTDAVRRIPPRADPTSRAAETRGLGRHQAPRVMRGGSWESSLGECRCASRDFRRRRYRTSGAGVRALYRLSLRLQV
jgi:formylglycine-generating enzyme required for sulfatase activity